jgi:hypothetical protein
MVAHTQQVNGRGSTRIQFSDSMIPGPHHSATHGGIELDNKCRAYHGKGHEPKG